MKNKKLLLFIIIAISVLFVLSGCSGAGISLNLSPNPIEFYEDQTVQTLELTVKTTGFGSLSLDNLIVEVFDENDESIFKEQEKIDVSAPIMVEGFSDTVDYTIDLEKIFNPADYDGYSSDEAFSLFYNGFLAGKTHTLRITVTGSNDSSLTAQINYNE